MGLFKPRKYVQNSVADHIDAHMRQIRALFGDAKLTLVVRSDKLEKPIVFTNDQPEAAMHAIRTMTEQKGPNVQVRN